MSEEVVNKKAIAFKQYLEKEQIKGFTPVDLEDNEVAFASGVMTNGQRVPFEILTDTTMYTIIRFHMGEAVVNERNRDAVIQYTLEMNRSFKVFKYMVTTDGDIVLDAVVPSYPDEFSPKLVLDVLDVVVDHVRNTYKDLMKVIWG